MPPQDTQIDGVANPLPPAAREALRGALFAGGSYALLAAIDGLILRGKLNNPGPDMDFFAGMALQILLFPGTILMIYLPVPIGTIFAAVCNITLLVLIGMGIGVLFRRHTRLVVALSLFLGACIPALVFIGLLLA